jgi:hypothetical protein
MPDLGQVEVNVVDLTRAISTGAGQKMVLLGYSSLAPLNTDFVRITRDTQLADAIGYGTLTEWGAPAVRNGGFQYFYPVAGSGGSVSAVTQTGSGPAVTVTGTPHIDATIKLLVSVGGSVNSGAARIQIARDGHTYSTSEYDVPAQTAAELVSTVDVSALDLSTLNTKHFAITTNDGNAVDVTMGSYATVAALILALNAGIAADGSNAVVLSTLRAGKYLVIRSGTAGPTSTITADVGDGMDELGLVGQSDTGEPASLAIPDLGVEVTFASGTLPVGTTYEATLTAPRCSTSDLADAIDSLRDSEIAFSAIAICQSFVDTAEAETFINALRARIAAWHNSEPYRAIGLLVGMPLGTVDDSGQQANDVAIRTQFADVKDRNVWWASGDCYANGMYSEGSFRRTSLVKLLIDFARLDESRSVGERAAGATPDISMTGPDGLTRARDEATALTAMADRWTVLTRYRGTPVFVTGRTAADPALEPGFLELAWSRPFFHAMQVAHNVLASKIEGTEPTLPSGRLVPAVAKAIESDVNAQLEAAIINPVGARQRASSCRFTYDLTNNFGANKTHRGTLTFQALGIAHSASIEGRLVSETEA